jgi:hypothetical protein
MLSRHMTIALTLVAALSASAGAQTTWYVDDDADPNGDGAAWATAFQSVQDALDVALAGDEIRVAGGTYVPSEPTDPNDARTATFQLVSGVGLYGGYAGLADPNDPDVRDFDVYESILSGDLAGNDGPEPFQNDEENCYHVVMGSAIGSTSLLDGFNIASGNADGDGQHDRGGAVYCYSSGPTLTNCTISGNSANDYGGGVHCSGSPTLSNCTVSGNLAGAHGGGICCWFGSSPTIVNCTISGNSANAGGGVCCEYGSGPTLNGCTISGNSAHLRGGGVLADYADTLALVDCTLTGNAAQRGGGVWDYGSSLSVMGCRFLSNAASYEWEAGGGICNDYGSLTLGNCEFSGNSASAGSGGAIYSYAGDVQIVVNCTFSGNMALSGSAVSSPLDPVTMANCILWNNSSSPIVVSDDGSSVTYSCVEGGYAGVNNIGVDPLLTDANGPDDIFGTEDDDLHLLAGSPCIDAADSDAVPEWLVTDTDGDDRLIGCRVDMGADESAAIGADCNGNGQSDGCDVFDGTSDDFDRNSVPDECEDCNGNGVPDRCDGDCDVGDCADHPLGCGASADCNGNGMADECEGAGILYVDDDASGAAAGTSWADAYTDLSYALRLAECTGAVSEIRVAAGRYRPNLTGLSSPREATLQLVNGVAVRGGYRGLSGGGDPNDRDVVGFESVLSGDIGVPEYGSDNCYHVVTASGVDSSAVLDGFTITGGNGDTGISPHWLGAGMYCHTGNPTVVNCTFVANSARYGGGIYANSSYLTIVNCTFCGNSASDDGGGITDYNSSPMLVNCAFLGNTANGSGGGMVNSSDSEPLLMNCTFSGNSASTGGGMANFSYSEPMLRNCTFSGNSGSTGGGIYNFSGGQTIASNCVFWGDTLYEINWGATVTYSCISWGWPGEGNINIDPLFVRVPSPGPDGEWGTADDDYGDLRLQTGSPCIDAGDNTAVPLDVLDLDGDGDVDERIPFDLDRNPRFVQDPFTPDTGVPDPPLYRFIVDMGAYEYQFCFGDLDSDNDIDIADLAQLLGSYGETAGMTYYDGDLDGDGDVDLADLAELLGVYGDVCS